MVVAQAHGGRGVGKEGREAEEGQRSAVHCGDPVVGTAWETDDLPVARPNSRRVATSRAPKGLAWNLRGAHELGRPRAPQDPGSLPPETTGLVA